MKRTKTVSTVWETRSYDVWGNAKDGYDVNDSFRGPTVTLRIPIQVNNEGTLYRFESAYPTHRQIRKALDLRRYQIELNGDDLTIYVERARDSYPVGELHCISHASLSPIRPIDNSTEVK